ncbi:hypothetical protein KCP71_10855 [Salmonella enterica subsp. enterica]|nr:hypothetical protein KCP71_10855 [Salmonella enterica subsp. enterica]
MLDEPSRDFDAHWLAVFEHWLATCRARGAPASWRLSMTLRSGVIFHGVVRLHNGAITPRNIVGQHAIDIRP